MKLIIKLRKQLNALMMNLKVHLKSFIEGFSTSFVKGVLDNPVYCGKLAFGRRKNEKIPGTRNEYQFFSSTLFIQVFIFRHKFLLVILILFYTNSCYLSNMTKRTPI